MYDTFYTTGPDAAGHWYEYDVAGNDHSGVVEKVVVRKCSSLANGTVLEVEPPRSMEPLAFIGPETAPTHDPARQEFQRRFPAFQFPRGAG